MKQRTIKFQEKIELIKASIKLSKFWGKEPSEILGFVALIDKDRMKKWNKIAKEVSDFDKMNIEDRAKKLGIKLLKNYEKKPKGKEILCIK